MKVTAKVSEQIFTPVEVTTVFETESELEMFIDFLGRDVTIPNYYANVAGITSSLFLQKWMRETQEQLADL